MPSAAVRRTGAACVNSTADALKIVRPDLTHDLPLRKPAARTDLELVVGDPVIPVLVQLEEEVRDLPRRDIGEDWP